MEEGYVIIIQPIAGATLKLSKQSASFEARRIRQYNYLI
jgi:hypothetical protein